jgi:hypothetical protein
MAKSNRVVWFVMANVFLWVTIVSALVASSLPVIISRDVREWKFERSSRLASQRGAAEESRADTVLRPRSARRAVRHKNSAGVIVANRAKHSTRVQK